MSGLHLARASTAAYVSESIITCSPEGGQASAQACVARIDVSSLHVLVAPLIILIEQLRSGDVAVPSHSYRHGF